MKEYLLGVDVGSSTLKITFLSPDGSTIGPFRREIYSVCPNPSWVEQDADSWRVLLTEALSEAFRSGGVKPAEIKAIAVDAATHTTVLLDSEYRPVDRAILWNDQRAAAIANRLDPEASQRVLALTNHAPGAMWSLFQNIWVKENKPATWSKVRYMLFAKDYLRFCLTGEYVTDSIDAQGSEFYNVHTRQWSKELADLMDFPVERLPRIQSPISPAGTVTPQASADTGLLAGTPVFTGTTDTLMEIVAAGAVRKGQATVKLATSGRICVIAEKPYPNPLLVNYGHVVDGLYYPGTGTRSCATSLKWYRDIFGWRSENGKNAYDRIDEAAQSIPPGSEGLFFHPYLLGEFTPYADESLRASFTGASMKSGTAHFARAVMEGCAYSIRDCVGVLEELDIKLPDELILIGGGASSRLWSQILADTLGKRLVVPAVSDSSLGSAMLAGVGCGVFRDFAHAVDVCVRYNGIVEPQAESVEQYDKMFGFYKRIQSALAPIYADWQFNA